MRQDQFERLQALEEKLIDVFLTEADPEHWPGKGLQLGAMDAKTRGDLYWVRKTAASAAVLVAKTRSMVEGQQGIDTSPNVDTAAEDASQLDEAISAAEQQAKQLMRELQTGTSKGKRAFDKRVHGKAPG